MESNNNAPAESNNIDDKDPEKEFEDWLNAPSKSYNWISLKNPGDSIVLVFDPTKKRVVTKPFKRKVKHDDGTIVEEVKDVQRAEYTVTKPEDPTNTEYTYEASKRHAKQLEDYFKDGIFELKITRRGTGTETYYDVRHVMKQQKLK
jgi:hypothetical protein